MDTIRTAAASAASHLARLVPARRSVRLLLAAVVAGLSLLGGITLTGGAAQAATSVKGCFAWSAGAPYANQPIHLHQWKGDRWVTIRSGKTNGAGCGTFLTTPSGAYLTISASTTLNSGYYLISYFGHSGRFVEPGSFSGTVGTAIVRETARVQSQSATAASAWGY